MSLSAYDLRRIIWARNVLRDAARHATFAAERAELQGEAAIRCAIAASLARTAARTLDLADANITRRRGKR